MKFPKIIKLAKKTTGKTIALYDGPAYRAQWISIGPAAYCIGDRFSLNPQALLQIMGIPDEKKSDWTVFTDPLTEYQEILLDEEPHSEDTACRFLPLGLMLEDGCYQPFLAAGKVWLVKSELLEPFDEGIGTDFRLREVVLPNGETKTGMLCRNGFSLEAVIIVSPGITPPYGEILRLLMEPGNE